FGIRRTGGAQAGQYPGGRTADRAADGERAICAGSGARRFRVAVRRKENAGTYRAHLENRQASAKLTPAANLKNVQKRIEIAIPARYSIGWRVLRAEAAGAARSGQHSGHQLSN